MTTRAPFGPTKHRRQQEVLLTEVALDIKHLPSAAALELSSIDLNPEQSTHRTRLYTASNARQHDEATRACPVGAALQRSSLPLVSRF